MDNISQLLARYFAVWNERDQERRCALLAQTWAEDGYLLGPLFRADGIDEINGVAAGLQEHFSAHEFRMAGEPSAHNDAVRFAWEIAPVGGDSPVAAGVDFGRLTSDGRIRSIVSFVDLFPAGIEAHG
jgi:hypothetical protein